MTCCCDAGSKGSLRLERALEVADEVVRVLDAHRQADHAGVDARLAQLLVGQAVVRRVDRQAGERLDAAEARRAGDERQPVVEALRPRAGRPRARGSRSPPKADICRRGERRGRGARAGPGRGRAARAGGPRARGRRARAFADWRSTRRCSVLTPRRARNAACGSRQPPRTFIVARAASMRSREPARAPPIRSLWPASVFVRLCITRSAPRARGRCRCGVAKVLSTTTTSARACADRARGREVHDLERGVRRALEDERAASSAPATASTCDRSSSAHEARASRRSAAASP